MSSHILVVHEVPDFARLAGQAVKRAFGEPEPFVIRSSNFEEALDNLKEGQAREWPMIVVGAAVPASPTSGATPGNYDALLDFLVAVRGMFQMPIVVLLPAEDPRLRERLSKWNNIEPVSMGLRELEERSRALHRQTPVETSLEIELILKDGEEGNWRIQRKGLKAFQQTGNFRIDKDIFDELVYMSGKIGLSTGEELRKALKIIGRNLERILFERGSNELQKNLFKQIGSVGIEHSRILFTMAANRHCAMVEALREGDADPINTYWMLTTPIVRQYETSSGRRPLFMDALSKSKPISCLIVNADPAAGTIKEGEWAGKYPALDHIREEADDIADYLTGVSECAGIEEVKRLDLSLEPGNAANNLRLQLEKKIWNIVHFAGHGTLSASNAEKPGLILSAERGVVYPYMNLANELKYTQFLYLSACHSSNPAFLKKAIEYSIPEVIGYLWEVDDVEAARFARDFYQRLFDKNLPTFKSLDHALVAARRCTYDHNPDSRIWASPVLLTQPRTGLD